MCRHCDQGHGGEARENRHGLQCPQSSRQPERSERIAGQREQRAVRRVLERPADELEDRVGRRFGGHVRVRVEPMQGTHPGERQVAEHVLRDQRRTQQQDHMRQHDRAGERRDGELRRGHQHQHVARTHQQHQRLEAAAGKADVEPAQRAGQPGRPAAAAAGDVLRWRRCRACAQQRDGGHDAEQSERAEDAERIIGPSARGSVSRVPRCAADRPNGGYWGARLHRAHCYVSPTCECPVRPIT